MFRGDDAKARQDPRLVELRSRMLEGIARVVELWSLDGEVADVSPKRAMILFACMPADRCRSSPASRPSSGDFSADEGHDDFDDLADPPFARL